MKFRNRKISYNTNGYPWVYWPKHPEALSNGMVYVHRVMAFEKFGSIPENYHVHHLDGNVENWDLENIVLMTDQEHGSEHSPDLILLNCDQCGKGFKRKQSEINKGGNYCSPNCSNKSKERINWPTTGALKEAVYQTSTVAVAGLLGVSDIAVHKRIRSRS